MEEEQEVVTTPNLWKAGHVILITKCKCNFEHNGTMLLFSLPKTEAVMKAMADFDSGGLVPAVEYSEICKRLRHEMYLAKNERESVSGTGERHGYRRAF